jgi:diguanylate cyclase (GGDEF)-like protein
VTAQIGFLVVRFRWRMITAVASRWLTWRQNVQGFGEKVIIVGGGEGYQVANWLLRRGELKYIFSVVGLVDDELPTIHGMRLDGGLVLGRTADLPDLVKKYDVGIILFATSQIATEVKDYVFQLCQTSNVRVAYIDNLLESIHQQLTRPVTSLEHSLWSEDHIKFMALHDCVTGLPDRFLFQDQLIRSIAYARRYETNPAVLFINLSGLKCESDTLKDMLLKEFSKRMLRLKRESDTLARLDDLVFGLILENADDENIVTVVARRIANSISDPFDVNDQKYCLDSNITVCMKLDCFSPGELSDIRRFYNQGKNIVVFEDEMLKLART